MLERAIIIGKMLILSSGNNLNNGYDQIKSIISMCMKMSVDFKTS